MSKPMNLRVAAGLAIFLLAGCVAGGGPVRDANLQWTPLHSAALSGDVAAIRSLLAGGANVNARNDGGMTPLHLAATKKKLVLATLEAVAKSGHDELSRAASKEMGLDTLGEADREGLVAILKSGDDDRTDTVRALLAGGANVDARAKDGFTPLHFAAGSGDVAAIRALLAGGANVDARAKDRSTPLHGAVLWAALSGDIAAIRALLASGADVSARKDGAATPLHGAALSGDVAAIRALLAGGADVNARGEDGFTPLHAAAMKKLILAALEADAKGSRDELLKMMGTAGFDTLAETDREIAVAILKGGADDRAAAVHALLVSGAAVNARTDNDGTPLHYAAMSGDAAAVKALLDAGGDPNAVAFGCGPMDVARLRMENTETSIAPFRDSIKTLRAAGGATAEGMQALTPDSDRSSCRWRAGETRCYPVRGESA